MSLIFGIEVLDELQAVVGDAIADGEDLDLVGDVGELALQIGGPVGQDVHEGHAGIAVALVHGDGSLVVPAGVGALHVLVGIDAQGLEVARGMMPPEVELAVVKQKLLPFDVLRAS